MDINDLFDGIMKSINQFAEGRSRRSCASRHSNIPVHQIAEQRLQEKMQDTGRGPENGGKTRRPWMAEGDSRKVGPSGREAGTAQRNAENFTPRHPWLRGLAARTACVQSARPAPWCAGEREAGYDRFPEKGVILAATPTP